MSTCGQSKIQPCLSTIWPADNMRTLESVYPMPIEGSRTRSNPIGWPTFDNLTCGFLLAESALFSPPPTSSSACFHKQTTYFSRQGFGKVGEPASIVRRFSPSSTFARLSLKEKKKRNACQRTTNTEGSLCSSSLSEPSARRGRLSQTSASRRNIAALICLSSATLIAPQPSLISGPWLACKLNCFLIFSRYVDGSWWWRGFLLHCASELRRHSVAVCVVTWQPC